MDLVFRVIFSIVEKYIYDEQVQQVYSKHYIAYLSDKGKD